MHFINVFIFSLRAQMKDIIVTIILTFHFSLKGLQSRHFCRSKCLQLIELVSEHKLTTLKVE